MTEFEIVQHQQMNSISLFFNTVDYRTAHIHSEWELIWVLDQPLTVICGQQELLVSPGELVLFSPREPHEFRRKNKSCTFLCLQISPKILADADQLSVDSVCLSSYLRSEDIQKLKVLLADFSMAYFMRKPNYKLLCNGNANLIMYQLLSALPCRRLSLEETESIDRRNARLMRLFRFVDENYMHKICLSDFAKLEGCSVSYLSHFVKDAIHQTFRDYVNSVRFHRACQLLAEGKRKMLDVCMESGFSDYRYFSRTFIKQFGMTPEQYSHQIASAHPTKEKLYHSLHSVERFYDPQESLALCESLLK